jgi:tetratricopeptide (TPR) repeat protein
MARHSQTLQWGLAGGLFLFLAALAQAKEPAPQKPPWQRLLQGADARKAAELAARVGELKEKGLFEEALAVAGELTALREKTQGKDHWQAAAARWEEAGLRRVVKAPRELQEEYAGVFALDRQEARLRDAGRSREAQIPAEKALEIRRKVLGEEHPTTAQSYNIVAVNLYAQSKYAEAEQGYRKALDIYHKTLGEESPHSATGYDNLAANLNAQGKYREAGQGMRKALEIRRRVLGQEDAETATSYNNLAFNLYDQGQHPEAEQGFRKALAICRKVLGEEERLTATCYSNVGLSLNAQGKYDEAAESYRKALDTRRKLLGEEHPDTALSYHNLAANLTAQGSYAQAEQGYRKALAVFRKVLGEGNALTAQSYNNLAHNLQTQGKSAEAEEGYRKALQIRLKVLGEEHPDTAESYNNLAANLNGQRKYTEAAEGFRKALDIRRKVFGDEYPGTATCYNNLAHNLADQGKYGEAVEDYRKPLDIFRKVLGEEHPDTASCYHNLAHNLNAQGKYKEAEELWVRAAASFASARLHLSRSGLDRATITSELSPLPRLACVLARNGKPRDAWRHFEESLSRGTWDDLSARLRRPAGEQAHQTQLAGRLQRLDLLLEQAAAIKEPTPQQTKARETLLGQRRKAQDELDAFARYLEKTYGPAAGQVFDVGLIQAALAPETALIGWIDLPTAGPRAADPSGEHWSCLLRARGDPVCVRLPGSGDGGAWTGDDVRLPADLRIALQKPRSDWQQLVSRLRRQRLTPLERHLAAQDGLPAVRHLVVLPSTLLAGVPVELIAEGTTISYAHSGTLFAHLRTQPKVKTQGLLALADPIFEAPALASKGKPLPPGGLLVTAVQPGSNAAKSRLRPGDVLLTYNDKPVTTAADLAALIAAAGDARSIPVKVWREDGDTPVEREVAPGKLGVVLADNPAPEAVKERRRLDDRLASRGGEWRELPGTRAEVASIAQLFADSPAPLVLTDSRASEQNLHELAASGELKKYRYLHLATHGEIDDRYPLRSAVILSRDALPDPGKQLLEGKPVFDGRLTAGEVLRQWNLDCELVTLSACQTALGKYERGEGFVGFAQALTLCGSRSVCLSLWQVDDAATALLMERFYANLLGKTEGLKGPLGKAAALAEAKSWLRTLPREEALKRAAVVYQGVDRGKRKALPREPAVPAPTPDAKNDCPYVHPYFWAAFVLTGDPD